MAAIAAGLIIWMWPERKLTGVHLNIALVAHWSPQSNARDTVNGFNGVVIGNVKVVSTNTAFAFDGGKIVVSNASKLNFGGNKDFSVTARIRPMQANTPYGVMSIVEKRSVVGISAAVGYSLHLEDGRLACQIAPDTPFTWSVSDFTSIPKFKAFLQRRNQIVPMKFERFITTGPDLRDGEFHDVALTMERKSATGGKLYVDGKVVMTFDPTKLPQSLINPSPLLIGGHPDPTLDCGFKGQMGEVRVYSRALSEAEIKALAGRSDGQP
jgi:hypothetical protein